MNLRAFRGCLLIWLMLLCWQGRAAAQIDPVELRVDRADVGLAGMARPGTWVPTKMQLRNNTAAVRTVICQWELDDPDGDLVRLRRQATLSPGRSQDVWLYGQPSPTKRPDTAWRYSVIDKDSGTVLARAISSPGGNVSPSVRVIGVSGAVPRGLESLRNDPEKTGPGQLNYGLVTQHEASQFLPNLMPQSLPDRWYGLSIMQSYIWTPEAGDPAAPTVSPDSIKALREWVRRGGHLVVVLPGAQDWWSQSPLADMMPDIELTSRSDVAMPSWLGIIPPMPDGAVGARPRIEVKQTRIKDGKELLYAVLCRDDTGVPLAVAGRYGFGRVTLIGIDLTSPQMIRMGLPSGRFNVWHDVFGWRSEAIPWTQLEEYAKDSRLYRPEYRDQKPIDGELIDRVIDMQETVGPLLLGASALFAIYWGLACPGSWYLLRRQKLEQHSWVVFTGIACVFVAIAWLAALFAKPAEARAAHYSVVDLDDKTGQVRVLSWATVFVPEHGKVRLDVDAGGKAASANGPSGTITAIGSLEQAGDSGFLDSQTYEVDAAAPSAMDVPFRGTAKRVQIDWRGPVESLAWPVASAPATTAPATQPVALARTNSHGIHGKIKRKADLLEGVLTHDLPGDLEEVRLIYPAADGGEPWVSAVPRWRPGQPLDLRAVTSALSDTGRAARQRLAIRASNSDESWTGYLGDLLRYAPGTTLDPATGRRLDIAPTSLVQAAQLLTFFDNLPPPRSISSKTTSVFNTEKERGISRGPGRAIEMSQALRLGRVILLAQVSDAPMLAPLHADGRSLPNKGWTFVRWVGELESAGK